MGLLSFRWLTSLQATLFLGVVAMALLPRPSVAQSFCGPVTVINFNGTNGQYPAAGVTITDRRGATCLCCEGTVRRKSQIRRKLTRVANRGRQA